MPIELPKRMRTLSKTSRGIVIPWFVDPKRQPLDFRVMSLPRFQDARRKRLCWICGKPHDKAVTFVGGPLSLASHIYADPPSHAECAEYAARVCPFMTSPDAVMSEGLPPDTLPMGAIPPTKQRSGLVALLEVASYEFLPDLDFYAATREGGKVRYFYKGEPASTARVRECIDRVRTFDEVRHHPQAARLLSRLNDLEDTL